MRSDDISFVQINGIAIFNRRQAKDFASLDPKVWNFEAEDNEYPRL